MFLPRNSFVTNTTLTHTNTPRKDMNIDPAVGSDHIVCYGGDDPTLLVTWHSITGRLVACATPCMACGSICQGNGAVGVDAQVQTHTDIHMYTDSTAYVNQDLECRVSDRLPIKSAFIGVYLINGGECCVSYELYAMIKLGQLMFIDAWLYESCPLPRAFPLVGMYCTFSSSLGAF